MGIFVWILKINMRYQIIVTHMPAASGQQISHFSQSWGWGEILSLSGPVGKEIDEEPLPYVLIHGQETLQSSLSVDIISTVEFQRDYYLSLALLCFHYFSLLANSLSL